MFKANSVVLTKLKNDMQELKDLAKEVIDKKLTEPSKLTAKQCYLNQMETYYKSFDDNYFYINDRIPHSLNKTHQLFLTNKILLSHAKEVVAEELKQLNQKAETQEDFLKAIYGMASPKVKKNDVLQLSPMHFLSFNGDQKETATKTIKPEVESQMGFPRTYL